MLIKPILSILSPASQTAGKEIAVEDFKVTDIPPAMDTLGWQQGARFMRKWLTGAAYEMPMDIKLGKTSANTLSPGQLLTDLPFEWLLNNSDRVQPAIDEKIEKLSVVNEFSDIVGRVKHPLDQLSKGLIVLMTRLKRFGVLNEKNRALHNDYFDFSNHSAMQLEDTSQFNLFPVGASKLEKATDTLDDVYGALGSFIIKIAATKLRTIANDHGFPAIEIEEIGLYVRDTYDFINVGDDQLLGYWSNQGVLRPGLVSYFTEPDHIDQGNTHYYKVTNDSFNEYRKTWNKGGDFVVFSTVKRYPVSIIVHLEKTDFDEFTARASSL